jgi:predicted Zn-dependent protease
MRGVVHDGLSARAHPVEIATGDRELVVTDAGGAVERVALDLLRRGDKGAGGRVIHRTDRPDWRLVPGEPLPPGWLGALPHVGQFSRRARSLYLGAGGATVAVIVGLMLFGDQLLDAAAPLVPHRVTAPMGEALVVQLGGRMCGDAGGTAALDRLVARLRPPAGFVEPVTVSVLDTPAVNALAAPGGRVVIFRGLIDKAQGPDEIAGVLAHELTHVALRHPTKALLRQMGVSVVVRSLGGDIGGLADTAVLLDQSRGAERAADLGAIATLHRTHISPSGLAAFFIRMRDADRTAAKDLATRAVDRFRDFAATHPGADERIATTKAAVSDQAVVAPAMNPADWQAMRRICN